MNEPFANLDGVVWFKDRDDIGLRSIGWSLTVQSMSFLIFGALEGNLQCSSKRLYRYNCISQHQVKVCSFLTRMHALAVLFFRDIVVNVIIGILLSSLVVFNSNPPPPLDLA
jgi:hypothetical protein